MKKTIITLLAVLTLATFTQAQDWKPAAKNKSLEVNFAPLGGSPISIGGVQFRMFNSETSAIRAGLFLGFSSSNKVTQDKADSTSPASAGAAELKTKSSSFEIGLQPGIEMHMAGTERLSPYWGAVLDLGFKGSTEKKEVGGATASAAVYEATTKNKEGFVRLGVMLALGTDWYFAKKAYLGAEMGVGLGIKSDATEKYSDDIPLATGEPSHDKDIKMGNGSEMNFGPTVNGKIRLGWVF